VRDKLASRVQTAVILALVVVFVVLAGRLLPKEYLEMRANVLAAYSFDGTLERVVPEGPEPRIASVSGRYEPGRAAQGLYLAEGAEATLPLAPEWNLPETGMVAFWLRPDGDAIARRFERILLIPGASFSLHKSREGRLVFRIGTKVVTTSARWGGGQWHHIAIGWARRPDLSEGPMELYLDGRRAETAFGPGDGRFPAAVPPLVLRIGGPAGTGFRGVLDELLLFNRLLNEKEVRTIYGRALSVKDIARVKDLPLSDALVNLAAGKTVTGSAAERSPDFAYSNVTDGDVHASSRAMPAADAAGPQYVQVDLGAAVPIDEVRLWHGGHGVYRGNRVEVSAHPDFQGEQTVLFDSDRDGEYPETPDGRAFRFPTREARYVRNWLQGERETGEKVWTEIRVLRDPDQPPPVVDPLAAPAPAEESAAPSSGVVVAVPPATTVIDEKTALRSAWIGRPIRCSGGWTQEVGRAFAVRADHAVRDVTATADPVVDASGRVLAGFSLHVIQPLRRGDGAQGPAPELLLKDDRVPLRRVFDTTGDFPEVQVYGDVRTDFEAGRTKAFWLVAEIAPHAAPGVYPAAARFTSPSGFALTVPVEVEVFPFEPLKPRHRYWGMSVGLHLADGPRAQLTARQRTAEFPYVTEDVYRRHLRSLARLGFDVLAILPPEQAFTGATSAVARVALMARAAGFFRGVMFYRDWWAYRGDPSAIQWGMDLAAFTRALVEFQTANHLPTAVLYEEEEPTERAASAVEARRPVIVEVGGYTAARIAGGHLDRFVARVDYPIVKPGSPFLARYAATSIRDRKKSPWYTYPTWIADPAAARQFAGYGFWVRNFDGILPTPYMQVFGDPFNGADGPAPDRCFVYPGKRGPILTRVAEATREGIDDFRTLQVFLIRARGLGIDLGDDVPRLDRLEMTMDEVWDAVLRQVQDGPGAEFEAARRTIAEAIVRLGVLAAPPETETTPAPTP
jgi:hypothetical protein